METAKLIIRWLPTVIFLTGLVAPTVKGYKRGYRKSTILFLNSLFTFLILGILYLFLVNTEAGDKFLFNLVTVFISKEDLGSLLNVNLDTEYFTVATSNIATKYLDQILPISGLAAAIQGSGGYIEALANFIYHILFAIVFYIVYLVVVFILSIFYLFFRSERRYIKKEAKRFRNNQAESTYKTSHIGGAFVGFVRGLISSIIAVSFLGSLYFVISGDAGTGKLNNLSIDQPTINDVREIYSEFDNYSNQGIYKVLSTFDGEDAPAYLYIPDLILSGSYTKDGKTYSLNIRKDLASYTLFAKELIAVLDKHSSEDVNKFFNNEITSTELLNKAMSLTEDPLFQNDLVYLVSEFPDSTYVSGLITDVADNLISFINLNSIGVPSEIVEPINILVKKDYLSDKIPEEKLIIEYNNSVLNEEDKIYLPSLKPSDIITKDDLVVLFNLAFTITPNLLNIEADSEIPFDLIKDLINGSINQIQELSILDESPNNTLNPALARVFYYAKAQYLDSENSPISGGKTPLSYSYQSLDSNKAKIDEYIQNINVNLNWAKEINSILDLSEDFFSLISIYNESEGEGLKKVLSLFDKNNENYQETKVIIEHLENYLTESTLLGEILGSRLITSSFESILKGTLSDKYMLPDDIAFTNVRNENGEIIKFGELYLLIKGAKLIVNENNIELLNTILNNTEGNVSSLIGTIVDCMSTKDENNKNLVDYAIDSSILSSIFSYLLIDKASDYIFVPSMCKVKIDNNETMMIKSDYLKDLLNSLVKLISKDEIRQLLSPSEGETPSISNLLPVLLSDEMLEMIKNPILQSTFGKFIYQSKDSLGTTLIIPLTYSDPEIWAINDEVYNLIVSVRSLDIDFDKMLSGELNIEQIISSIGTDIDTKFNSLLESDIIYYTISNLIDGMDFGDSFKIIIPESATKFLGSDRIDLGDNKYLTRVVRKEELKLLVKNIVSLGLIDLLFGENKEELNINTLLGSVTENRKQLFSSSILSATIAYLFNAMLGEVEAIVIPDSLKNAATVEKLEKFDMNNPWYNELPSFFEIIYYSTKEINDSSITKPLGYKTVVEDEFSIDNIVNNLMKMISNYDVICEEGTSKTYLDLLYGSIIVKSTISKMLDGFISDMINEKALNKAKQNGIYKKNEIESLLKLLKDNDISFDTSGETKFPTDLTGFKLPDSYSYLIRGLITHFASGIDALVVPKSSIEYDSNCIYESEIDIIKSLLTSSFDPSSFTIEKIKELIGASSSSCKSYIVLSTLSNYLFESGKDLLVVPVSTISYDRDLNGNNVEYIKFSEFIKLLDSLAATKEGNEKLPILDYVSLEGLKITDELLYSDIMNATVVSLISKNSTNLKALASTLIFSEDYLHENKTIVLLNASEKQALIKAISVVSSGDTVDNLSFSVDLDTLTDSRINAVSNSSICRALVTEKIIATLESKNLSISLYNATFSVIDPSFTRIDTTSRSMYKLSDPTSEIRDVCFSKVEIKSLLDWMKK